MNPLPPEHSECLLAQIRTALCDAKLAIHSVLSLLNELDRPSSPPAPPKPLPPGSRNVEDYFGLGNFPLRVDTAEPPSMPAGDVCPLPAPDAPICPCVDPPPATVRCSLCGVEMNPHCALFDGMCYMCYKYGRLKNP